MKPLYDWPDPPPLRLSEFTNGKSLALELQCRAKGLRGHSYRLYGIIIGIVLSGIIIIAVGLSNV